LKLQKQVDYLDRHPECAICFHNVAIVYDDQSQQAWNSNPPDQKRVSRIEDLFEGCFIQTCSTMFRRGLFSKFPRWYTTDHSPDWSLHILNAQYGTVDYIDEVLGAYRQHEGGYWSSLGPIEQQRRITEFYENWLSGAPRKHRRQLRILL